MDESNTHDLITEACHNCKHTAWENAACDECIKAAIEEATTVAAARAELAQIELAKLRVAHESEQGADLLSDIRLFLIRYRNGVVEHAEALALQGRIDLFTSRQNAAHASEPPPSLALRIRDCLNRWAARYAESPHAKKHVAETRALIREIDKLHEP